MFAPRGVYSGGICSQGGLLCGDLLPGDVCSGGGGSVTGGLQAHSPVTATAVGGTHPTGMHSCFMLKSIGLGNNHSGIKIT